MCASGVSYYISSSCFISSSLLTWLELQSSSILWMILLILILHWCFNFSEYEWNLMALMIQIVQAQSLCFQIRALLALSVFMPWTRTTDSFTIFPLYEAWFSLWFTLWVSMPWAQTTDSFSLKSSSDFLMLYTILKHFISWFWIKMWARQFYKQWYELMVKRVLRRKRHL